MEIGYKPTFIRQLNALEAGLREEALERIEEFKDSKNHTRLRVHPLKGFYSFSVDYRHGIVFEWIGKHKSFAALTSIGDHTIYE